MQVLGQRRYARSRLLTTSPLFSNSWSYKRMKIGAVAQLGERQNRTLEAVGSIPIGSI